jgi:membrane fusion protein, heavy metal efflux system
MGLESVEAGAASIISILELPGEIVLDADKVAHVVPRVSGVVLQATKNLGDRVEKGEAVAVIDSRELGEARSRYLVAVEREKLARYNIERTGRLWQKEMVPEKEYLTGQKAFLEEKIELTSATRKLRAMGLSEKDINELVSENTENLTHFMIQAPFDGVVIKKHLSQGEWVKEDSEIYIIADLSTVWVDITVYAKDITSVRLGQKASVQADAYGLEAEGTVSYVGPLVGEESRTARARIVIPNDNGQWKPGLFAKVKLVTEEVEVPVAVRNEAIQDLGNNKVVFVQYDDQFEAHPVRLGRSDRQNTEVIKGLSAGEKYVVRNSFILKSELGKSGMSHQH